MRVAYLGPDGSFSSRAARALFPAGSLNDVSALDEVVARVADQRADVGVLPLLNRRAGPVPGSLTMLAASSSVGVAQLLWLPIDLCLLGVPGAQLDAVRVVRSHPVALKQAPSLTVGRHCEPTDSTASAAAGVRVSGQPSVAALADRALGDALGLEVLAEAAPNDHNATLFAGLLGERPPPSEEQGLFLGPVASAPPEALVIDDGLALWSGAPAAGATRLGPPVAP